MCITGKQFGQNSMWTIQLFQLSWNVSQPVFLENTDYKTFDIRYMSPLSDISLTQYLSHSIGQKHLFEVRTMYPLQYTFYVWPENSVVMKYLLSMLASL